MTRPLNSIRYLRVGGRRGGQASIERFGPTTTIRLPSNISITIRGQSVSINQSGRDRRRRYGPRHRTGPVHANSSHPNQSQQQTRRGEERRAHRAWPRRERMADVGTAITENTTVNMPQNVPQNLPVRLAANQNVSGSRMGTELTVHENRYIAEQQQPLRSVAVELRNARAQPGHSEPLGAAELAWRTDVLTFAGLDVPVNERFPVEEAMEAMAIDSDLIYIEDDTSGTVL